MENGKEAVQGLQIRLTVFSGKKRENCYKGTGKTGVPRDRVYEQAGTECTGREGHMKREGNSQRCGRSDEKTATYKCSEVQEGEGGQERKEQEKVQI